VTPHLRAARCLVWTRSRRLRAHGRITQDFRFSWKISSETPLQRAKTLFVVWAKTSSGTPVTAPTLTSFPLFGGDGVLILEFASAPWAVVRLGGGDVPGADAVRPHLVFVRLDFV